MKNNIQIFSLLFCAWIIILAYSCTKESRETGLISISGPSNPNGRISVSGKDAGSGLKSTLNNFTTEWIASADRVGIYAAEARTTEGGSTPILNAVFTAAASGATSAFNGIMYWGAPSTSHTFYAYYPYASGAPQSTNVPISLASDQSQSTANNTDHLGALDFLIATPNTVTSPAVNTAISNAVSLNYNHLFTILEFQIKGSGTLKAVKLIGNSILAFGGGNIDITQSTPPFGTNYNMSYSNIRNQVVLSLATSSTLTSSNADTKAFMVINPSTPTGNCNIGFSEDGTIWKYISKIAPVGGFERGKKYIVSVDASSATPSVGSVSDVDGNSYSTILIGTQTWMAENLKTTKYNDGTAIRQVTENAEWINLKTGSYSWYNNDQAAYGVNYGSLYNWYAVDNNAATKGASNGGKNLCPVGWHVPSDSEWTILYSYLINNNYGFGGSGADIAKSLSSTSLWTIDDNAGNPGNNQETNNSSGFNAIPGGFRFGSDWDGSFALINLLSNLWSSSEASPTDGLERIIDYSMDLPDIGTVGKEYGISVRCLKD